MKPYRENPNKFIPHVNCRFGAPMGRRTIADNPNASVILFRVKMYDQCYDIGGAYWGMADVRHGVYPLYAAIGSGFQYFFRSSSLRTAEQELREEYPELKIKPIPVGQFVTSYPPSGAA